MDRFISALISQSTHTIPPEDDWFAPLIGDWDFHRTKHVNGAAHHEKGEWFFRRAFDGNGIVDLMICSNQPGVIQRSMVIRMYHADEKYYEMVYASGNNALRLHFEKTGNYLIGNTEMDPGEKWVFSDISARSFKWNHIIVHEGGKWEIKTSIYATRKLN